MKHNTINHHCLPFYYYLFNWAPSESRMNIYCPKIYGAFFAKKKMRYRSTTLSVSRKKERCALTPTPTARARRNERDSTPFLRLELAEAEVWCRRHHHQAQPRPGPLLEACPGGWDAGGSPAAPLLPKVTFLRSAPSRCVSDRCWTWPWTGTEETLTLLVAKRILSTRRNWPLLSLYRCPSFHLPPIFKVPFLAAALHSVSRGRSCSFV